MPKFSHTLNSGMGYIMRTEAAILGRILNLTNSCHPNQCLLELGGITGALTLLTVIFPVKPVFSKLFCVFTTKR